MIPHVELLVVDNNSSDDTRGLINRMALFWPVIRYVFEPKQGLSNARNCGAQNARGAHLLFLDDDALVPEGFVGVMADIIKRYDPDFFGGPIIPIYADHLPKEFPESLEVRKKASSSGFHRDVTMSGGNFGVRASTLRALGGFDPQYGMTGNKVGMLEERMLINKYKEMTPVAKQRLYYSLEGYLFHHTPAQRMTFEFQKKRIYIGDYQMTRHIMSKGLRAPEMFARSARERLINLVREIALMRVSLRSHGKIQFIKNIEFWRSFAVVHGIFDHRMERLFGRGHEKKPETQSTAPLRLLWVAIPEGNSAESRSSRDAKDRRVIEEIFAGMPILVDRVEFEKMPSSKQQLNDKILAASPSAFDVILFENEILRGVGRVLRAHFPHLQFLVRVRRTRLMSLIDNLEFGKGFLKILNLNKSQIRNAIAKDRTTVKYADLVVSSSHWERRFYLRFFGPRRKFAYVPPSLPADVVSLAQEAVAGSDRKKKRLLIPSDVTISTYESKQVFRAISYFDQAVKKFPKLMKGWRIVQLGKKPEKQYRRSVPGVAYAGLADRKAYFAELASATAVVHGGSFLSGHPTRFLEAALCKTVVVLPEAAARKLDPSLAPFIESYSPRSTASFVQAVRRAAKQHDRPFHKVLNPMTVASQRAWAAIIGDCRRWMQPTVLPEAGCRTPEKQVGAKTLN